jgi:hypothetical protein
MGRSCFNISSLGIPLIETQIFRDIPAPTARQPRMTLARRVCYSFTVEDFHVIFA